VSVLQDVPGRAIVWASLAGTAVFVAVNSVEAIALGGTRPVGVVLDLVLFAVGCVAFFWAYAVAVARSRTEEIGVGGLFFLAGTVAPAKIRLLMDGALGVQCVVALVTASVRPFTTLAFGILVPMFGLGLNGVWGARHGTFGPRRLVAPAAGADEAVTETPNDAQPGPPIEQNAEHG
jgi:hypothetical protein